MASQKPPPGPPAPNRSARQRARTRRSLIAAGRDLISEKGVAGLRINDITERADVALGSFYNHFESKEDLVDVVVGESLQAIADSIVAQASDDGDPGLVIGASVRRFVGLGYDDPTFARLVVNLSHADAVFVAAIEPSARAVISAGIERGRFSVVDLDVAVVTLSGGSIALLRAILDGRQGPGAAEAYAAQCLRTLGVPPDEALRIAQAPLQPIGD